MQGLVSVSWISPLAQPLDRLSAGSPDEELVVNSEGSHPYISTRHQVPRVALLGSHSLSSQDGREEGCSQVQDCSVCKTWDWDSQKAHSVCVCVCPGTKQECPIQCG